MIHRRWMLICVIGVLIQVGQSGSTCGHAPGLVEDTTTWIVVRHADRDGENDALTEDGFRRANELAQLTAVLRIDAVYTTDYVRTTETVRPTAEQLGLPIQNYQFNPRASDHPGLEDMIAQANGSTVLVAGHSNTVGPILRELGVEQEIVIEEDEFHRLFIVQQEASVTRMIELRYGE